MTSRSKKAIYAIVVLLLSVAGTTIVWRAPWKPQEIPPEEEEIVRITSRGDFQMIQGSDDRDQVELLAESSSSKKTILWKISGPGKGFVAMRSHQEGNISRAQIELRKPAPRNWVDDSWIAIAVSLAGNPGVTSLSSGDAGSTPPNAMAAIEFHELSASPADQPSNSDANDGERKIHLVKFRRGGQTAPGSSSVCLELTRLKPGEDDSRYGYFFQPVSTQVSAERPHSFEGSYPESGYASERMKVVYSDPHDRGEATYRLAGRLEVNGSLSGSAKYEGAWHDASYRVAAGVAAFADNSPIPIADNTLGIGFGGHTKTLTLGFDIGHDEDGDLDIRRTGIAVSIMLSNEDSRALEKSPRGHYNLVVEGHHAPGLELVITRDVYIHAMIEIEQKGDDEWSLGASAQASADFSRGKAGHPAICFSPRL